VEVRPEQAKAAADPAKPGLLFACRIAARAQDAVQKAQDNALQQARAPQRTVPVKRNRIATTAGPQAEAERTAAQPRAAIIALESPCVTPCKSRRSTQQCGASPDQSQGPDHRNLTVAAPRDQQPRNPAEGQQQLGKANQLWQRDRAAPPAMSPGPAARQPPASSSAAAAYHQSGPAAGRARENGGRPATLTRPLARGPVPWCAPTKGPMRRSQRSVGDTAGTA